MDGLPKGFDLPLLLTPITAQAPAGTDLRHDVTPQSPYFRLRDARAEARASEREADTKGDGSVVPQQWRVVFQLAQEAIATRSKDLEIAAWLTEAALRLHHLGGFTAGALLMAGLVERFWEALHPLPDDEGMATRVAPVTGLNGQGRDGTLVQPLGRLILFKRRDGRLLSYWEYEQSEGIKEAERKQRHAADVPLFAELQDDARAADTSEWAALRRQADAALAAWSALGGRLDALAGADSPPTARVHELIEKIRKVAAIYAPAETVLAETAPAASAAIPADNAEVMPAVAATRDGSTRDDMLRELVSIAEFFRRTEPHSPLAYTLDEAVRRGRMTWPQLLHEVLPEAAARNSILSKLGIRPETEIDG